MKKNHKFEIEEKITIYENLTKKEFLDLMSIIEHIRVLVCSDGTVYAWNGFHKTHEEIMKLLGQSDGLARNLGNYQFNSKDELDSIFKLAKKYKVKSKKNK